MNSLCGFDAAFQQQAITEIDSALNRWRDLIPEHCTCNITVSPFIDGAAYSQRWTPVRWDPTRADPVFFDQSVALHCAFYHLQIHVHRPFIPMVRKCSPSVRVVLFQITSSKLIHLSCIQSLPSLAVCTSAARACANIVDIQRRRMGNVPCTLNLVSYPRSSIDQGAPLTYVHRTRYSPQASS